MTCAKGCCESQAAHYRSVGVARVRQHRKEVAWERDMKAYRNLRADGLQPPSVHGARRLEQQAVSREQVETGMVHVKPESFERFADAFGHKATETPA